MLQRNKSQLVFVHRTMKGLFPFTFFLPLTFFLGASLHKESTHLPWNDSEMDLTLKVG